LRKHKQLTWTV
jgi:importin subunit beta-1